MTHAHPHHDENFILDQICTVFVCGLLAAIGFLIWKVDLLMKFNILTSQFNLFVLLGSVVLAALTIIRGVSIWNLVGERKMHAQKLAEHVHSHDHECDHHGPGEACDHDHGPAGHVHDDDHHDHDHDHHDHDHDHHDHSDHEHSHAHDHGHGHDHGHDHSFAPWRYAVMIVPLLLSAMLLYYHFDKINLVYSTDRLVKMGEGGDVEFEAGQLQSKKGSGEVQPVGFKELTAAAQTQDQRDYWSGKMAEVKGLFNPKGNREFSVFRLRMTCCASDAVPVKVRIFTPTDVSQFGLEAGKGVVVTGQVEFRKAKGTNDYFPVLLATGAKQEDIGVDVYVDQ